MAQVRMVQSRSLWRQPSQMRLPKGGRAYPLACRSTLTCSPVRNVGGLNPVCPFCCLDGLQSMNATERPSALGCNACLAGAQQTHGSSSRIHGLSITEPCVDWLHTEELIRSLASAVRQRRDKAAGEGGTKKRARS